MEKRLAFLLAAVLMFFGLQTPVLAQETGEPPVAELEQQFIDLLYQETTENGIVKNYDSLEALKQDLEEIMTESLADYYLDTFYYEQNGNLYLEARDGPTLLQTEEPYSLEKVNDTTYKLTQSSHNELEGDYTLTITYSYEAGEWIFADRMDVTSSETGGELPDTATANPLLILLGLSLAGAGSLLLVRKTRTE